MPRKKASIGTPQDWLRRARGNLARAKQVKPKEAFWEDLCFDAQQAAEKATKAVLTRREIDFPKTHDIRELLTLLSTSGEVVPEAIWEAINLADYAVETRYPGPAEPVTRKEYREAVAIAGKVVKWAEKLISAKQR